MTIANQQHVVASMCLGSVIRRSEQNARACTAEELQENEETQGSVRPGWACTPSRTHRISPPPYSQ